MTIDTSGGHKDMDYPEHIRTYNGFWLATKISVIAVVALLIFMAVTLV